MESFEYPANNPTTGGRRMPLIVVAIIAVLVGLGLAFAVPW